MPAVLLVAAVGRLCMEGRLMAVRPVLDTVQQWRIPGEADWVRGAGASFPLEPRAPPLAVLSVDNVRALLYDTASPWAFLGSARARQS